MQLASGFMQLAAAGCRHNILHFHCLFEGKMLLVMTIFKVFIRGGLSFDICSEVTFYSSAEAST